MLDISFGLLLISGIIFLIMIWALNNILYVPILSFMEDRENSLKIDLNYAKDNDTYVDELNKEAASIIEEAKIQADKIKELATKEAKENANKILSNNRQKLESDYNNFIKSLSKEKVEYKKNLLLNSKTFINSIKSKISEI